MTDVKKSGQDVELELARKLINSVSLIANASESTISEMKDLSDQQLSEFKKAQECLQLLQQTMNVESLTEETLALPEYDAASLKRIGRFRIVREIGKGGFGIVLLARDETLDRDVALKIPRADTLLSSESRKRFEREARAAGVLAHPAIVPIYEFGRMGPVNYIAFAYCNGTSLDHWLEGRSERLSPKLAARIVARLAEAVSHAHLRGVIHRDLKPSNILIAHEADSADEIDLVSSLRITDFGLAKLTDDNEELTLDGALIGTPTYMSPEQATGSNESHPAVDVYSLGVILFQLLTGEVPFRGNSNLAILKAVAENQTPSPRSLNREVSSELAAICLKCLEKDPQQRYESALALCDDLNRFIEDRPVRARQRSWSHEFRMWSKRNPVIALLSLLLLSSMIVGTVTAWNLYRNAQSSLVLAEANFTTAKDTVDSLFEKAMSTELQAQPKIRSEMLTTVATYYNKFIQQEQDSGLDFELAVAKRKLAQIDKDMGDHEKALERLRQAQAMLKREVGDDAPVEQKLELLSNLSDIALALDELDDHEEALIHCGVAEAFGAALIKEHPKDETVVLGYSRTLKNKGYVFHEMKDYDRAKQYYDQALQLRQSLLDLEPDNPEFRFRVAYSHSTLALWFIQRKQPVDALRSGQANLELLRELAESHPEELKYRIHLPVALNRLSDVYRRFPNHYEDWAVEAADHLKQAERLQRELLEEFPLFMQIRRGFFNTLANFASVHLKNGEAELAVEKYRQAIEALKDCIPKEGEPTLSQRRWFVDLHEDLADGLHRLENYAEAQLNYKAALEFCQGVMDQKRDDRDVEQPSRWLRIRGILYFRLENYTQAIQDLQEFYSGGGENWEVVTFIARAQLAMGDLPAALESCDLTTQLAGGDCYANLVRASVYAAMGDSKLVKQELEKGRKYLETGKLVRLQIRRAEIEALAEDAEAAIK